VKTDSYAETGCLFSNRKRSICSCQPWQFHQRGSHKQKYQPSERKRQFQVCHGLHCLPCAPKPGPAPGKPPAWNKFAAIWVPSDGLALYRCHRPRKPAEQKRRRKRRVEKRSESWKGRIYSELENRRKVAGIFWKALPQGQARPAPLRSFAWDRHRTMC